MNNYYFTFMQRQSYLRDKYFKVEAPDWHTARQILFNIVNDQFAFQYTEEEFSGQPEKYNLTEIFEDDLRKYINL